MPIRSYQNAAYKYIFEMSWVPICNWLDYVIMNWSLINNAYGQVGQGTWESMYKNSKQIFAIPSGLWHFWFTSPTRSAHDLLWWQTNVQLCAAQHMILTVYMVHHSCRHDRILSNRSLFAFYHSIQQPPTYLTIKSQFNAHLHVMWDIHSQSSLCVEWLQQNINTQLGCHE